MSTGPSTIERLALALGRALEPLGQQLSNPATFFARLGIVPSAAVYAAGALPAAIFALATALKDLKAAVDALNVAIDTDDSPSITLNGASSLEKIASIIKNLATAGSALDNAIQSDASLSPAEKLRLHTLIADLPKRTFDLLMIDALVSGNVSSAVVLNLTGLVDIVASPGDGADPTLPASITRAVRLERLGAFISSPLEHFKTLLGFGLPSFDGRVLFERLKTILDNRFERAEIIVEVGIPNALQAPTFTLAVDGSVSPPGLVLPLRQQRVADTTLEVPLGDWQLKLAQTGRFPADSLLKLSTSGEVAVVPPSGQATLGYSARLGAERKAPPFTLFAAGGGTVITVESIAFEASLVASWNAASGRASAHPALTVEFNGGKVRISTKEGADGFIAKVLSGFEIESPFDVGIDFSLANGLHFQGSSALEVQLAPHFSLGPLAVNALTLSIGIKDGAFPIAITADLKTSLGPLTAIVQGIGFKIDVALSSDNKGNLGPVDLQPGFKAPKGVGLSLDAGGFKGGGFLLLDAEKGEYAGALELDFKGFVTVKAIGIINTKMPDGSKTFSLLIVISAEFIPIQLSFGFTLNGVGGIFGLNRMIVVDALAEGIRTNAVKSILFPENVIANITRIISDIKQFFPPQNDHFVVGPMAKLGWGTPSIITVELGLLLDLPEPKIIIVGVLKAVLPEESIAILRLQVNFIGVVDFERGYIFFRADLYDSRLLIYSITGSMAFLVSWGETQTFALSVGGFHPDFREIPTIPALPNGFRNMARIGISLLSDDNPRLKVESYFAVTSNTVQFGAKVELYAAAAGFNVYGFLGYDVLFQFEPFRFIAKLYGGIALRAGTEVIAGINIAAQLMGPTPWDARGDASLTILFFEISVSFHVTWGDPPAAIQPATEDLKQVLLREYSDTRNWRAELPPNSHLHVSLRKVDPPAAGEMLVIHPAGVLTFSQRSLPLEDYLIQKFGNKKPLGDNKFKLTNANSNGSPIPADFQSVREQFAPGNFTELNDSDKLSRRSFEKLPSGFRLTGTSALLTTLPVVRTVAYELSYLRQKSLVLSGIVELATRAYDRLVKSSAVRQSTLSRQQNRRSLNAPLEVELPKEGFALASSADMKSHLKDGDGAVVFATQAEAYQRQQELLEMDPALVGQIQVVSHFELNAN